MSDYADEISLSLVTDGGHLAVGRGGFCLHYGYYRLLGNDSDAIKRAAVNAGLPIIDSRSMPFEIAARLAISGPMVAVNRVSDNAWQTFFEAPLAIVATTYRHFGADIYNISDDLITNCWFMEHSLISLDCRLEAWLAHFLR